MAHTGQVLVNEVTGQQITFRRTSDDTGGEMLELESAFRPDEPRPPRHSHPDQEERFEILTGRVGCKLGRETRSLQAGERLVIPAGTQHEMWAEGGGEATVIWQTVPALETERMFETLWGLANDGKTNKKGLPRPLQGAVMMHHYRREMRLPFPPAVLQPLVFGVGAWIGRRFGLHASYERYSGGGG